MRVGDSLWTKRLHLIAYVLLFAAMVAVLLSMDAKGIPFIDLGYNKEVQLLLFVKYFVSSLIISFIGIHMTKTEAYRLTRDATVAGRISNHRRKYHEIFESDVTENQKLNQWYAYYQTLSDNDKRQIWNEYHYAQYQKAKELELSIEAAILAIDKRPATL